MAKRLATTDLNHDNWDEEEEPEDRGTFKKAPENELKNRVIKKARRKFPAGKDGTDGTDDVASKGVFSGFSGFGNITTGGTSSGLGSSATAPFSFLSNIATTSNTSDAITNFSFGSTNAAAKKCKADNSPTNSASDTTKDEVVKSGTFGAKLKKLNQSVSEWIKTHVDNNAFCILSPIFKEYDKYLKEIEEEETKFKKSVTGAPEKETQSPGKATNTAVPFSGFKFSTTACTTSSTGAVSTNAPKFGLGSFTASSSTTTNKPSIFGGPSKSVAEPTKTNGFNFGLKADEKTTSTDSTSSTTKSFSFGNKLEEKSSSTPFTFGTNIDNKESEKKPPAFSFTSGSTPFTFGNIKPPAPSAQEALNEKPKDEDEEDEPPKVEFKQVVEEDAVYSKKCKVYVKKDGNYVDRGVGTLYLKPVKDSEKVQLLVRADTNLGNILVNLILSEGIPIQRMGKNNVMMVCVPSPDVEKATPMLLRVKTSEEADDLLATLQKYQK